MGLKLQVEENGFVRHRLRQMGLGQHDTSSAFADLA